MATSKERGIQRIGSKDPQSIAKCNLYYNNKGESEIENRPNFVAHSNGNVLSQQKNARQRKNIFLTLESRVL